MTRKLLLLDLALVALLFALAWQMRREWVWAHAREQALLRARINPKPVPPLAPLAKVAPLAAVSYADVAQMNLFSKDRNPQVIIEQALPVPKPMPPFPVARGVLLWDGTPPTVLLSERPGSMQKGYHPGDRIGEWKILSVDNQYVIFEWDGKQFKKRLDELMDQTALLMAEAPPSPAPSIAPAASRVQSLSDSSKSGPGIDVGAANMRMCTPGDKTPPGTIVDGMKKVVSATPFGDACRWEAVK